MTGIAVSFAKEAARRLVRHHPTGSLLAVVLAGCGPSIKGLQHDPSFSYESLKAGRISVGGVTSLVHEDEDRSVLGTRLASQLHAALLGRDLDASPAGIYRNALGAERYEAILDGYRLDGLLSPEVLSEWGSLSANPARYVVFSRVESDLVTQQSTETSEMRGSEQHWVTKMTTRRTATVAFQVHDLTEGKVVWSALLSDGKELARTYDPPKASDEEAKDEDKGLLEMAGEALLDALASDESEKMEYPEPPTRDEVIVRIFKEFAESLPKPD